MPIACSLTAQTHPDRIEQPERIVGDRVFESIPKYKGAWITHLRRPQVPLLGYSVHGYDTLEVPDSSQARQG